MSEYIIPVGTVQESSVVIDSITQTTLKLSPEVAVKILTRPQREPDLPADHISDIRNHSVNPKHDANQNLLRTDRNKLKPYRFPTIHRLFQLRNRIQKINSQHTHRIRLSRNDFARFLAKRHKAIIRVCHHSSFPVVGEPSTSHATGKDATSKTAASLHEVTIISGST